MTASDRRRRHERVRSRFALAVNSEIGRWGQPLLDELVTRPVGDQRRQGGVHVRDEGAPLFEDHPCALTRAFRELTCDHEPLELLRCDVVGALQILDDGIDLVIDQGRQRIGRGVEDERLFLRFDVVGDSGVVGRAHLGPKLNFASSARVFASSTGESSLVTTTNGEL
jgi:hypothetical protein